MRPKIRLGRLRARQDVGFGSSASGRFINKDGFPNVRRRGVPLLGRFSWYHTMLNLSSARFIAYLVFGYIFINVFFALLYYIVGVQHLTGIDHSGALGEFIDVFFFSSQTFTTVGYGRIAPVGFLASLLSTFEAFLGLLSFAIATGLFYGRFSRPRAFVKFSKNILISPFEGGAALMFRVAPYKNNALSDVEVIGNAAIQTPGEPGGSSNFYSLKFEFSHIDILSLNWTLVHRIDEASPFCGFSREDFSTAGIEVIVQLRAFDEVFANTVVQRSSYVTSEIVFGAKFQKMYGPDRSGEFTILDLSKLDEFEAAALPESTILQ